jgi:hypothetical protein
VEVVVFDPSYATASCVAVGLLIGDLRRDEGEQLGLELIELGDARRHMANMSIKTLMPSTERSQHPR